MSLLPIAVDIQIAEHYVWGEVCDGWRLLTVGRQLERLLQLSDALSRGFYTNAVHDAAGHGVVLALFDSTISFHARDQRSRSPAALIEHVVLNQQNPRSLGGVLQLLQDRLARLRQAGVPPFGEEAALHVPAPDELPRLCQADAIGDFVHLQTLLAQWMAAGARLSEQIALRHFSLAADARTSLGA